MILIHPADLGLHLGDGNTGGVIHIDRCIVQFFSRQSQILPVLGAQRTGTEGLTVDTGLRREDTVSQLLLGHFQTEDSHRHLLLHGHAGGDVQRKTGLAHAGTGCQNDQIAAAKAGKHGVQQTEAGGDALVLVGIRAADLLQVGQRLQRGQGAGIAAGADLVDALLGVFQQKVGVRLVPGVLQDVLGDTHQLTHQIFFLHDLGVGLYIGDAGHCFCQTGQVDLSFVCTGEHTIGHHRIQQGDKIDGLVVGEQAQHLRPDLGVLPGVEHFRLDDLHQIGQSVWLEQHRAQHALFCLHIVGQIDAHALQIQFIGITSFVRHSSLSLSKIQSIL